MSIVLQVILLYNDAFVNARGFNKLGWGPAFAKFHAIPKWTEIRQKLELSQKNSEDQENTRFLAAP